MKTLDRSRPCFNPFRKLLSSKVFFTSAVTCRRTKVWLLVATIFWGHAISISAAATGNRGIYISAERLALVIGNSAYHPVPLRNPANDAEDMSTLLSGLGFKVTLKKNIDRRSLEDAIRQFGHQLRHGGVGLFYFAGHGMQVGGRNYLIPIDARIESEADVKYEAVDAGFVLGKMEDAQNQLNIVILDACRNNPFSRSFRSHEIGLARMDAPTGSLIVYATAPGEVAADGPERNGIFTKYLIKHIPTPNLSVEQVLKRVRIEVAAETKHRQIPWESSSLMGDFFFRIENDLKPAKIKNETLEQAPIQPKDFVLPKDQKRYELALFPALEEYHSGGWLTKIEDVDKLIIDSLKKILVEKTDFSVSYSYYDFELQSRSKNISEDLITEKVKSKLWQREILSTHQKPNIELICELGRELKVDAVITFWVYYDATDQIVNAFFVDINRKVVIEALEKSDDLKGTNVSSAIRHAMVSKIRKVTSEIFDKIDLTR